MLSKEYDKNEILVESSPNQRCLLSAKYNLAGMYGQQFSNNPSYIDPYVIGDTNYEDGFPLTLKHNVNCPLYEQKLKEYRQSDQFLIMQERLDPLYKYFTLHTGETIAEYLPAGLLIDTLEIEYWNNKTYIKNLLLFLNKNEHTYIIFILQLVCRTGQKSLI